MSTSPDSPATGLLLEALSNLKVLLVDDHEATRKGVQLCLRGLNCKTDVAENGFEALKLLRQSQYNLVFMDLMMPVMDGLAATRQIRIEMTQEAQPVIIGISADSSEESRDLCLAAGMDCFLSKPLDLEELLRMVNKIALECFDLSIRKDPTRWDVEEAPSVLIRAAKPVDCCQCGLHELLASH